MSSSQQQEAVVAPPRPTVATDPAAAKPIRYELLKRTHPTYDKLYWAELRALYEGGRRLLRDPELFERLFPKHEGERDKNYQERKKRAFYVNHLATAIDYLVAGLAADPLELKPPSAAKPTPPKLRPVGAPAPANDEKPAPPFGKPKEKAPPTLMAVSEIVKLDPFYEEWMKDVSHPKVKARLRLNELMLQQAREGLLMGCFWTLVDMPRATGLARNRAEQEELGELRPYAMQVPVECVLDWEESEEGALKWANVFSTRQDRPSVADDRDITIEDYVIYTADGWAKYRVLYSTKQDDAGRVVIPKPKDQDLIAPLDSGTYTFGRVPLIRGKVPAGLWAGNKLFSMVVEYLNKSCGLSWAEFKSLYAQLYEMLAPATPGLDTAINEHQEDPYRAENQIRGPGYVQIRGNEDDAKFVGPDTSAFAHVAEQLKRLKEDIFRVLYQMALAEDNSGAVIRRSADSKELDHTVTQVVLEATGDLVRDHSCDVIDTAAAERGDEAGWTASGMENFSGVDVEAVVNRSVALETVQVPSATFQQMQKLKLAKAELGEEATPEVVDAIKAELASAITQDQLEEARTLQLTPPPPPGFDGEGGGEGGGKGDDEEEDDDDGGPPPRPRPGAKAGAKPKGRPFAFSSKVAR